MPRERLRCAEDVATILEHLDADERSGISPEKAAAASRLGEGLLLKPGGDEVLSRRNTEHPLLP